MDTRNAIAQLVLLIALPTASFFFIFWGNKENNSYDCENGDLLHINYCIKSECVSNNSIIYPNYQYPTIFLSIGYTVSIVASLLFIYKKLQNLYEDDDYFDVNDNDIYDIETDEFAQQLKEDKKNSGTPYIFADMIKNRHSGSIKIICKIQIQKRLNIIICIIKLISSISTMIFFNSSIKEYYEIAFFVLLLIWLFVEDIIMAFKKEFMKSIFILPKSPLNNLPSQMKIGDYYHFEYVPFGIIDTINPKNFMRLCPKYQKMMENYNCIGKIISTQIPTDYTSKDKIYDGKTYKYVYCNSDYILYMINQNNNELIVFRLK
jgi:hypothetical protein